MTQERLNQILERRVIAGQRFLLTDELVNNIATNSLLAIGEMQIEMITSEPELWISRIAEVRNMLVNSGYVGEPSEARLRAEVLVEISKGWLNYANESFEEGDMLTFIAYADLFAGSGVVGSAIVNADNLNTQQMKVVKDQNTPEVAQIISGYSGDIATGRSADLFLGMNRIQQEYADLLKEDPSGFLVAKRALMHASTKPKNDPFPLPNKPEFVSVGAKVAIRILEELKKVQESS